MLLADLLRGSSDLGQEEAQFFARALWSSVHGAVFLAEGGGLGPIGHDEVPAMIAALVRTVVAGLPRRGAGGPG